MEEGVPSLPLRPLDPNTTTANHTPNIDTTEPTKHNNDSNSSIVPFNKDTYIIRVPKEQIFRVPPPENAKIIEEYLNKNKRSHQTAQQHCSRLTYVIAIVFIIVLLCISALVGFYFLANPSFPNFIIDHVNTVGMRPNFDITIRVHNPSTIMDFHYDAAEVDLSYRGKYIAHGELPTFKIVRYDTKEIRVSLKGSKDGLPKEIDTSPKGSKKIVPLSLMVDIPVKLGLGALRMREKIFKVDCEFRVSKWGKEMHIVSQTCKTKI